MKTIFSKYAVILAALLSLALGGCAKAPEAEDTLVTITAPTVVPVVTPAPTPVPTPTPSPTPKPKATEKPEPTEKPKEEKEDEPKATEKPNADSDTPNGDSYTPVGLKEYNTKVKSFSAPASNGKTITQDYFGGGKLTIVNVWSTT